MENNFNLDEFMGGLIESPQDQRDYLLSAISPIPANLPVEMPRTFDIPIHNQGSNPSCVGHSCAAIRSYLAYKQGIEIQFDGEWIYQECKKIDGLPNTAGTFFRAGLQIMQKVGAMPLGGGDPAKWKIGAYAQVDDLLQLDKANYLFGAVLAGFKGSNQGWQQAKVRQPLANESQWGHAVFRAGFGRDKFGIIQNSWGNKKGDNGIFYHSPDYLPFEAWIISADLDLAGNAESKTIGWVADCGATDGNTIMANLKLRETPNGKIIKVLPAGTKFIILENLDGKVGGYWWNKIEII